MVVVVEVVIRATRTRSVDFANTTSTAILRASIFGVTGVIVELVVIGNTTMIHQPPTTTGRVVVTVWRNGGGNGVDQTTMYMLPKPNTLDPLFLTTTDGVGEV